MIPNNTNNFHTDLQFFSEAEDDLQLIDSINEKFNTQASAEEIPKLLLTHFVNNILDEISVQKNKKELNCLNELSGLVLQLEIRSGLQNNKTIQSLDKIIILAAKCIQEDLKLSSKQSLIINPLESADNKLKQYVREKAQELGLNPRGVIEERSSEQFKKLCAYITRRYPKFNLLKFKNIEDFQKNGHPLHFAAARNDLTLIRLLINAGANIDQVDNQGNTVLDLLTVPNQKKDFTEKGITEYVNNFDPTHREYKEIVLYLIKYQTKNEILNAKSILYLIKSNSQSDEWLVDICNSLIKNKHLGHNANSLIEIIMNDPFPLSLTENGKISTGCKICLEHLIKNNKHDIKLNIESIVNFVRTCNSENLGWFMDNFDFLINGDNAATIGHAILDNINTYVDVFIFKKLIENGLNIDVLDKEGHSFLYKAVNVMNNQLVELILNKKADNSSHLTSLALARNKKLILEREKFELNKIFEKIKSMESNPGKSILNSENKWENKQLLLKNAQNLELLDQIIKMLERS